MLSTGDTIVALGTPRGVSALAVIRVSGPASRAIVQEVFAPGGIEPRRVVRGDYRDRRGQILDDVLWTFFAGPRSYTGEDGVEISCHGNPVLVQLVVDDIVKRGIRPAEAGEFTRRAFLGGRIDLSQAEAVMDLIHARSERALAVANQQLRGALGRRMEAFIEALLSALARIEAYIDFPEEDLPAADQATLMTELAKVSAGLSQLRASQRFGDLLRDGLKTVILGAPNAGKSSLLNLLVGRDRAIVSPEPGTTRDFLEEGIVVGPHWLRLIDTAGLNQTPGRIEELGMAKTMEQALEADLFLWVIDGTGPSPTPLPAAITGRLAWENTLVVRNKIDLWASSSGHTKSDARPIPVNSDQNSVKGGELPPCGAFREVGVSALTGEGAADLNAAIVALADAMQPATGGEVIAVNARHGQALDEANRSLASALDKLREGAPSELLASDLRAALEACGAISGRVDNERMLDHLFATFCIGK